MHEAVFSASRQAKRGVHALDIAKFLIDEGIHPPTVYFPLTVKESMMIEPTESESKQTIDQFVKAMAKADELSRTTPGIFADMPRTTPVTRPDEVKAARDMNTNYFGSTPLPQSPKMMLNHHERPSVSEGVEGLP